MAAAAAKLATMPAAEGTEFRHMCMHLTRKDASLGHVECHGRHARTARGIVEAEP